MSKFTFLIGLAVGLFFSESIFLAVNKVEAEGVNVLDVIFPVAYNKPAKGPFLGCAVDSGEITRTQADRMKFLFIDSHEEPKHNGRYSHDGSRNGS